MLEETELFKSKGNSFRGISLWLFDLDNTLYDSTVRAFPEIHMRMAHYIAKHLNLPLKEAENLQHTYWREFGATFLGLERLHGIDPIDFFKETHTFDIESAVAPCVNPMLLRKTIVDLPGRKAILTNGPHAYAERVLHTLGIADVFEAVLAPEEVRVPGRWRCKPEKEAFTSATSFLHAPLSSTVMIDDGLKNLKAAKALNMKTIWCAGHGKLLSPKKPTYVDYVVRDVSELAKITEHHFLQVKEKVSYVENR